MKKILNLVWILVVAVLLTACSNRRYGEGEVVKVLINPSGEPQTQFFMNLRLYNHSDEVVNAVVEGFEYLDGETWVSIPPISEEEWVQELGFRLSAKDHQGDITNTTLGFSDWLNPDYPTTGTFRVSVRVYDLEGNYQFTQTSNERELSYFTFD